VFLLGGTVEDSTVLEEVLEDGCTFESVVLDPALKSHAVIRELKLVVREVGDQDCIWEIAKHKLADGDMKPLILLCTIGK